MFASINMIWAQYAKQWKTWLGTWGGSKPICAQWKEEMSTSNCNVAEVFLFRYGCTHSILIPFCQNILMTLLYIDGKEYDENIFEMSGTIDEIIACLRIFYRMIEYMSSRKLSSNCFKCYYMLVFMIKECINVGWKLIFPRAFVEMCTICWISVLLMFINNVWNKYAIIVLSNKR